MTLNTLQWVGLLGEEVGDIIHPVRWPSLRARSSEAERPAHNRLVVGSNPTEPTNTEGQLLVELRASVGANRTAWAAAA